MDRRTAIDSVLVKDHQATRSSTSSPPLWVLRFATPGGAGPLEDADAAIKRRDYTTAVQLIRPLAEQGDANAQYKLAVFYDNSLGVPQDKVSAYMWLNLSAAQGREGTAAFRDLVARRMSPAQKEEAQKLAHEWKSLSR